MNYIDRVAVGDCREYLFQNDGSVAFVEPAPVDNFSEKFASLHVVRNDVEPVGIIEVLVDLDNVGVVNFSQNAYFVEHSQLVRRGNLIFLEDLDGPFLFAFSVGALTHFAVGPLAQDLAYFVIASKQADSLLNKHFVT